MELYSHSRYKGYLLFVEDTTDEDYPYYEGVAQLNGTTVFTSKSITGDGAELKLQEKIDGEE
tara:strand:+ start:485 stop:670 length:186 start_codon:yes stop_codon:yes gene_type:complete